MIVRFLWYTILPYLPFLGIGLVLYWIVRMKEYHWVNRKPSWIACISEALVLLLMGSIVLALSCTDAKNGGLLGNMKDIPLSYLRYHIIAVVAVALACMFGVLLSTFGRTSRGIILVALSLAFYGWLINGPGHPDLTFHIPKQTEYVIDINGYDHVSADLWINDVYLGKTPVTISRDDLIRRVPSLPEPPSDARLEIELYDKRGSQSTEIRRLWNEGLVGILGRIPVAHVKGGSIGRRHDPIDHATMGYYARIRYASEEGYQGRGGGGSSESGQFVNRYSCSIEVFLPELEKRWEKLLDIARVRHYQPDAGWFDSVETYGRYGWRKLREVSKTEPEFVGILDMWINRRYNLDSVINKSSALAAFNMILNEADKECEYSTTSISGMAIGRIFSYIDYESFLTEEIGKLSDIKCSSLRMWKENGITQIAVIGPNRKKNIGNVESGPWLLPSDGVLCHVIWLWDQYLDSLDESEDNDIEKQIVPFLVLKMRKRVDERWLSVAIEIGGNSSYSFFYKQPWWKDLEEEGMSEFGNTIWLGGKEVNAWLYGLSQIRAPEGKKFRSQHRIELLDLAGIIDKAEITRTSWDPRLDFLFEDMSRGRESLAYTYWPSFSSRSDNILGDPAAEWHYLVQMEPLPTVEMYVDCWRRVKEDSRVPEKGLNELKILGQEKRKAIIRGVLADLDEVNDRYLICKLGDTLNTPEEEATEILQEMKSPPKPPVYRPENIALWLEHTEPTHPLVSLLAKDSDPKFRLLVMGALRAQPVPENVALLNTLLSDPDPSVATAAKVVREYLDKLAATSPMEFASNPDQLDGEGAGELTVPCE